MVAAPERLDFVVAPVTPDAPLKLAPGKVLHDL